MVPLLVLIVPLLAAAAPCQTLAVGRRRPTDGGTERLKRTQPSIYTTYYHSQKITTIMEANLNFSEKTISEAIESKVHSGARIKLSFLTCNPPPPQKVVNDINEKRMGSFLFFPHCQFFFEKSVKMPI